MATREGLAQRRYLKWQIVLLNDAVGPNALNQRMLADNGPPSLDQRNQHVERAYAEVQRLIVSQ
ncbi:MAG: hypothetical protein QOF90_3140 [Acetobacteraceae bacterium]|nr:hypothetical protein [Acetobacteraceae bacterium]